MAAAGFDPAAEIGTWRQYFHACVLSAPRVMSAKDKRGAGWRGPWMGMMRTYLLRKLHGYEQEHGVRLADYLDLHYYAQGGSTTDVTRSLWDSTYTDPSWIGAKIRLPASAGVSSFG